LVTSRTIFFSTSTRSRQSSRRRFFSQKMQAVVSGAVVSLSMARR
jgi:hypothetical protein